MSVLLRHLDRMAAIRLAIAALPDAWDGTAPAATRAALQAVKSITESEDAIGIALAALPDRAFCRRYPESVGRAVAALEATRCTCHDRSPIPPGQLQCCQPCLRDLREAQAGRI